MNPARLLSRLSPVAAGLVLLVMVGAGTAPASADGPLIDPIRAHNPQFCPNMVWPTQQLADPTQPWSKREFHLVLAIDPSFKTYEGSDWLDDAHAIIAEASAVYEANFNIVLKVVDVQELSAGDIELTGTGSEILADLIGIYQTEHADVDRHAVLLMLGQDVAGGVVGQVECVGGAINTEKFSYMWMESSIDEFTFQFVFTEFYSDASTKVLVHELGHLLAGRHDWGNCAEQAPAYDPFKAADVCTIMSPYLDFLGLEFSTHNTLLMRGWAEYLELPHAT